MSDFGALAELARHLLAIDGHNEGPGQDTYILEFEDYRFIESAVEVQEMQPAVAREIAKIVIANQDLLRACGFDFDFAVIESLAGGPGVKIGDPVRTEPTEGDLVRLGIQRPGALPTRQAQITNGNLIVRYPSDDSISSQLRTHVPACMRKSHNIEKGNDVWALNVSATSRALSVLGPNSFSYDQNELAKYDGSRPWLTEGEDRHGHIETTEAGIVVLPGLLDDVDSIFDWVPTQHLAQHFHDAGSYRTNDFCGRSHFTVANEAAGYVAKFLAANPMAADDGFIELATLYPDTPLQPLWLNYSAANQVIGLHFSSSFIQCEQRHRTTLNVLGISPTSSRGIYYITLSAAWARIDEFRAFCTSLGAVFPDEVEEAFEGFRAADRINQQRQREVLELSWAKQGSLVNVEHCADLDPHQLVVAEYGELTGWHYLVGDPMGLGKTRSVIAALLHRYANLADQRVLIIVPANAVGVWANEIKVNVAGVELNVVTLSTKHVYALPKAGVFIISYDLLGSVSHSVGPLGFKPNEGTWAHHFCSEGSQPDALVVDEIHYIMHRRSNRSRATTAISAGIAGRSDSTIIGITGTVAPNGRASELINVLRAVDCLDAVGGDRFVRTAFRNGAMGVLALNERMRATCYIRRPKRGPNGVLPDLPEPDRRHIPVDLDPAVMAHYRVAETDVIGYILAMSGQEAASKAGRAELLVKINTLRQLIGRAKVRAAITWITELLERDPSGKVVVFAMHTEVINAIASHFDALIIDGGVRSQARMAVQNEFQEDPERRVIVCSTLAAAVSLTLTKARDVLFVEFAWRPSDHSQGEARAYGRLNDPHGVTTTYLHGEDTIDQWMSLILSYKQQIVDALEDGVIVDSDDDDESVFDAIVAGLKAKGEDDYRLFDETISGIRIKAEQAQHLVHVTREIEENLRKRTIEAPRQLELG